MSIKLTFLGAAQNVTGSQYLLEANNIRLLIDCGLHQEREFKSRDWGPFHYPLDSIDVVLLTHAHLDHSGLLPKLVREGYRGKIYSTTATAEIAQIILQDSAKIMEEDAEQKKKRHEREGRQAPFPEIPLYTVADAQAAAPYFAPVDYEKPLKFGENVEVSFHDAGHVLGSAMLKIVVTEGQEKRTIVFSGDVGARNKPILRDLTVFPQADYVVIESTYGDRLHERPGNIAEDLADVINYTVQARGNIVVPSFALERSQEMLFYMNGLLRENRIPHIIVFADSPMANNITGIFERHPELYDKEMTELLHQHKNPFRFPGLEYVNTVEESKAINHVVGTAMIIAGSGMCNGGRVKHHLVSNISRRESTILFIGYQAQGTLGRRILDGDKIVRILGQNYRVRAKIAQIHGFSGHADRDGLYQWLTALGKPPRRVIVTHGEIDSAHRFADFVAKGTGWQVAVPAYGDTLQLS
ncbi:MAG: MBL fold metallo-hydrolase [Dehalococcoidales bacterium]|nr:MBL fold metallo-hydrolase [Dehalococcoidales bacterium]